MSLTRSEAGRAAGVVVGLLLVVLSVALVVPARSAPRPGRRGGTVAWGRMPDAAYRRAHGGDVSAADRDRLRALLARRSRGAGAAAVPSSPLPMAYGFLPQAGLPNRDDFFWNFVDLDPGPGGLDYHCGAWTYDGHSGHDYVIRTFAEQEVGVPVFAAADGVVIDTHDGEPDHNTDGPDAPANYVFLDHGGGQQVLYVHLRRGSVQVDVGDRVVAGQQIGMVGSSGHSVAPHLHFETWIDGDVVEPMQGRCNPAPSGFTDQPKHARRTYVWDFSTSAEPLPPQQQRWPFRFPGSVQVPVGAPQFHYWFLVANIPAHSTYRMRLLLPGSGGDVAFDSGERPFGNAEDLALSWWWHSWPTSMFGGRTGRWVLVLDINGNRQLRARFRAVDVPDPGFNRRPRALRELRFTPRRPVAGKVLEASFRHHLVNDDPDFDVVRYHWVWTVAGTVVRDLVTASHRDVLRGDLLQQGDRVRVTVTPSDGRLRGRPSRIGRRVR